MRNDINVNNGIVLTDFSHNDRGNPHDQYNHLKGRTGFKADNANKLVRVASFVVDKTLGSDGSAYANFKIVNAFTGSERTQVVDIFARVRKTGVNIISKVQSSHLMDISAIVTEDNTQTYRLDIFAKNYVNYGQFFIYEHSAYYDNIAFIEYPKGTEEWLTMLPSGTTKTVTLIDLLAVRSNLDYGGYRYNPDGSVFVWGNSIVTPDALNTPKLLTVTLPITFSVNGYWYNVIPKVQNPHQVFASVSSLTTNSIDIYVTRTDSLTATTVNWVVYGK